MPKNTNRIEKGTEEHTPPHGDPVGERALGSKSKDAPPAPALETALSSGTDEPERPSYSDPLPARSHSLDPSVPESQESREQAPPSPEWLSPENRT